MSTRYYALHDDGTLAFEAPAAPSGAGGLAGMVTVNGFNAAAINAAIAQAEAQAGSSVGGGGMNGVAPIWFPPGAYTADQPILINKSGHTWHGSGQRSCTLVAKRANAAIVAPGAAPIVGFKVSDMGFENIDGLAGTTALDLTGMRHWTLSRVLAGWFSRAGIYLAGGAPLDGSQDNMFGLIDNCVLENMSATALGAIYADPVKRGAGYVTVRDCQINGDTSHPTSSLGIVGSLPSGEIHGVKTEGVYQPLDIQGQGLFVDRNVFEVTSGGPMTVRIRANANSWPGAAAYSTIAVELSRNQYQTYGQPAQFWLVVDAGATDVYQQLDGNPSGNPFLITRKLA